MYSKGRNPGTCIHIGFSLTIPCMQNWIACLKIFGWVSKGAGTCEPSPPTQEPALASASAGEASPWNSAACKNNVITTGYIISARMFHVHQGCCGSCLRLGQTPSNNGVHLGGDASPFNPILIQARSPPWHAFLQVLDSTIEVWLPKVDYQCK